jgi:DNA-binding GntR family transcriptional regulator
MRGATRARVRGAQQDMPETSASVTHSQTISERLAEEIIRGQLAPGTRLDEQSLATRFKVSRSPVRDALRQLAATRLVEYFPHRGFSVARLDPVDLDQMFEAAAELEALCARLCALRAGTTDRKRIEHIHQQAKQAVAGRETKIYAALNEDLHRTIYAGARNKTLEGLALNLRQRLAPFRARLCRSRLCPARRCSGPNQVPRRRCNRVRSRP